jgi:hypothetical protein
LKHRPEAFLPLTRMELLFRIRRWVDVPIGKVLCSRPAGEATMSETEVMGHTKDPAPQILARLLLLQMLKEGEENFLDDLLGVVSLQTDGNKIAQQTVSVLIEETENFVLEQTETVGVDGPGGPSGVRQ